MRRLLARAILAIFVLTSVQPRSEAHSEKDSGSQGSGPHIVMIIRHAEKPDDSKVDKDPNLSPRGFERAKALAKVVPDNFSRPDYLIATKRSAHSNRPMETIEPLSQALHLTIEAKYKDDDFTALAHEVLGDPKYAGKTVLIAWHHGKIPQLARALGVADAPDTWNSKEFDRVWQITYQDGKATFANLPQKALPGDSQK